MFKPGMKVRHRSGRENRIATLVQPATGMSGKKGWRVLIGAYNGFWFEPNIIPIVETNEEAVVFLNKADTL